MNRLLLLLGLFVSTAQASVSLQSGGLSQSWIDWNGRAHQLYNVARVYNSQSSWVGLWGKSWCSDFDVFVKVQSKKPKVIQCGVLQPDSLLVTDGYYWRTLPTGEKQKFNKLGQLIEATVAKNKFTLMYKNNRLDKFLNHKITVQLHYQHNGFVSQLVVSDGRQVSYTYNGGTLTKVKNAWGNIYKYYFSKEGLLQIVQYPDKTKESIVYNPSGKVVAYIDRNLCKESFLYANPVYKTQSQVTAVKYCGKTLVHAREYTNTFSLDLNNKLVLERSLERIGKQYVERHYDLTTGRPLSVNTPRALLSYHYNKRGQWAGKTTKNLVDSSSIVQSVQPTPRGVIVETARLNKRDQQRWRSKKNYVYDSLGRLQSIDQSPSRKKIAFQYDDTNKISQISEGKESILKITYEKKWGKIQKVTLVGKGSIEMVYGTNGTLKHIRGVDRSISSVIDRKLKNYRNFMSNKVIQ